MVAVPDPLFPGLAPPAKVFERAGAYDPATAETTPEERAGGVASLVGQLAEGFRAAGAFETGAVEVANAGCPDPYIVNGHGVEIVQCDGIRLPLGIRSDVDYSTTTRRLDPGSRLLLLSDGIPEASIAEGQPLGYEALQQIVDALTLFQGGFFCQRLPQGGRGQFANFLQILLGLLTHSKAVAVQVANEFRDPLSIDPEVRAQRLRQERHQRLRRPRRAF